jgi:hypothetical protein
MRQLYENFHIFYFQKRKVSSETKRRNTVDMLERLKTKASKVFCFVFHGGFKITNFNL